MYGTGTGTHAFGPSECKQSSRSRWAPGSGMPPTDSIWISPQDKKSTRILYNITFSKKENFQNLKSSYHNLTSHRGIGLLLCLEDTGAVLRWLIARDLTLFFLHSGRMHSDTVRCSWTDPWTPDWSGMHPRLHHPEVADR